MDLLLLGSGLLISGYVINNNKTKPRETEQRQKLKEYNEPPGEHIYSQSEIPKGTEKIQQIITERREASKQPGSNLFFPNTALWRDASVALRDRLPIKGEEAVYGKILDLNKGIPTQKFKLEGFEADFTHSNMLPNFRNRNNMDFQSQQGSLLLKPEKEEVGSLFNNKQQNPFTKKGTYDLEEEKNRLQLGSSQNGVNPYQEEREKPLLTSKVSLPGDTIIDYRVETKTVDDLRHPNQVRSEFENRIARGGLSSERGDAGILSKVKRESSYDIKALKGVQTGPNSAMANRFETEAFVKDRKEVPLAESYLPVPTSGFAKRVDLSREHRLNSNKTQTNTYRALPKPINNALAVNSSENRDLKQVAMTETVKYSQIRGILEKSGSYQNRETFVPKFTLKEFNVVNNYTPSADAPHKEGAYRSHQTEVKGSSKKDIFGVYTPAPSKANVFAKLGDGRDTRKNSQRVSHLNGAYAGNKLAKLGEDVRGGKNSYADNNRLREESITLPQQLKENELLPSWLKMKK